MNGAAFDQILNRYGQTVEIVRENGERTRARAMVQPIRENRTAALPSPLGEGRRDRFLCLGEPGVSIEPGELVRWNGRSFTVKNAQAVYVGARLSHWWAVLAARDEED